MNPGAHFEDASTAAAATESILHVACAADAKYLPHTAAMLYTLLHHHPGAQVHFLHGEELDTSALTPLAGMVQDMGGGWHAHRIPAAWIAGLPGMAFIPPIMWYRVYLPELLPEVDRLLYLDCDTLVMQDLTPLWKTDLNGRYLAAVANVFEQTSANWPQRLGLPAGQGYFNSGVLLMNLAAMRTGKVTQALVECGRNRAAELRWPDQDALNLVLGSACVLLHPRWNCQNSFFYYAHSRDYFTGTELSEATSRPGILHFEGGLLAKPWHYLNSHPYRNHYREARAQTPWPEIVYEGKTWLNRLLKPWPFTWQVWCLRNLYRMRRKLARLSP